MNTSTVTELTAIVEDRRAQFEPMWKCALCPAMTPKATGPLCADCRAEQEEAEQEQQELQSLVPLGVRRV